MTFIIPKTLDLIVEFFLFAVFACIHYVFKSDGAISLDDLLMIGALWLAIFMYRLIFLQLPVSWLASYLLIKESTIAATVKLAGINFVSFVVVIYISSFLSPVVSGFLGDERIYLPILVLFATTLSPLLRALFFTLHRG